MCEPCVCVQNILPGRFRSVSQAYVFRTSYPRDLDESKKYAKIGN